MLKPCQNLNPCTIRLHPLGLIMLMVVHLNSPLPPPNPFPLTVVPPVSIPTGLDYAFQLLSLCLPGLLTSALLRFIIHTMVIATLPPPNPFPLAVVPPVSIPTGFDYASQLPSLCMTVEAALRPVPLTPRSRAPRIHPYRVRLRIPAAGGIGDRGCRHCPHCSSRRCSADGAAAHAQGRRHGCRLGDGRE